MSYEETEDTISGTILAYISKSRKNIRFSKFKIRLSVPYLYCPGEYINNSGKRLPHWKALQTDFEK